MWLAGGVLTRELSNSWLKIGRADEHAKLVCEEIAAWKNREPYTITSHRTPDGHFHHLLIHFEAAFSRDRWALIIGDCVHNLRSALDHLVYAIAVREAGTDPPPDERRLQFPICDSPVKFSEQEWRLQSLSQTVRTVLEAVQPYKRLHPSLPPLLGLLREFDDRDKHRLLNVAVDRQQTGNFQVECLLPSKVVEMLANDGPLVDGGTGEIHR